MKPRAPNSTLFEDTVASCAPQSACFSWQICRRNFSPSNAVLISASVAKACAAQALQQLISSNILRSNIVFVAFKSLCARTPSFARRSLVVASFQKSASFGKLGKRRKNTLCCTSPPACAGVSGHSKQLRGVSNNLRVQDALLQFFHPPARHLSPIRNEGNKGAKQHKDLTEHHKNKETT